jgi:acyl-CoA reductase-like NAD-dependent aldehyde dehydrogenase
MHLFRSAYAALEYEIAEERASALARLGQRLEAALAALAACPRTANSDRNIRQGLVERAGYALWLFVVQREACGLNKIDHVIQVYGVPNEVVARMGPLAMPSMHPTRTVGVAETRAPLF